MALDLTLTTTIAGIPVYDASTEEHFSAKANSAKRIIQCDWTNRVTLAQQLIGFTSPGGSTVAPATYPDAPFLSVTGVDIKGLAGKNGMITGPNGLVAYDYAELEVTYGTQDDEGNSTGEALGEENLEVASEMLVFSRDEPTFKWVSDSTPLPPEASPGKIIPVITFTKTRKRMRTIPKAALFAIAEAPVNSNTYLDAPAGKLRFEGAQTSRELTTNGEKRWSMTVKLAFRPIPWNQFLRPSTGNYEEIQTINGGNPLYASSSFTPLGLE